MRDFYILLGNSYRESNHNKSESSYILNGNHIEFYGVDNEGKVRGPAREWLFINEANRVKEDVWNQLDPRTKELVLIDFNPDREFWAHDLKGRADVKWIHSTYQDNDKLDQRIIDTIESRRHLENWWTVYGMGELGEIENIIYPNWKFQTFDDSLPYGYGQDFGFSASPDALIKVAIDEKRKRIYLKECFYKRGNSSDDLRKLMELEIKGRQRIIADSSEDRLIREFQKWFNIHGANKYGGSVVDGIKIMQSYLICCDPDSENLAKELKYYRWKDRGAELPEKEFDHLLDAARYYVLDQLSGGRARTKAY
jgi:phage terminase large subunit